MEPNSDEQHLEMVRKEIYKHKESCHKDMPEPCNLCKEKFSKGDEIVFFTTVVGPSTITIRCAHVECATNARWIDQVRSVVSPQASKDIKGAVKIGRKLLGERRRRQGR